MVQRASLPAAKPTRLTALSSLNGGLGPLAPGSAPGVLNWATFATAANGGATNPAGGTANEINPWALAWYAAAQQRNQLVGTVDQRLFSNVSFYGEGFYANRRAQTMNPVFNSAATGNDLFVAVPTTNPYFPIGAPATLRINYNISLEVPPRTSSAETADRYLGGLKVDLPANWEGRVYYSETFDDTHYHYTVANPNAVSAALGWTLPAATLAVGTLPAIGSWTKPATIPYLNLFCDPRAFACNSPATLNYIGATSSFGTNRWINEKGVNFDGPLFSLPAGEVKAAIGGAYTDESFLFNSYDVTSAATLTVPSLSSSEDRRFWAVFAQLNIPLLGDNFSLPLMRRFEIEASWRHDQYSDFGGTSNPKIGFNWMVDQDFGLIFRGDWGTSFRAPSFGEIDPLVTNQINAINTPLANSNSASNLICNPSPHSLAGKLLNPGSGLIGWNGIVSNNGTPGTACGTQAQPTGLSIQDAGTVAINDGLRVYINQQQNVMRPESATNWGFTAELAPTAFLKGLDIRATWYQVKINGVLAGFGDTGTPGLNDPSQGFSYIVPTDIAKAGVDVAGCSNNNTPTTCPEFEHMVQAILSEPRNPVPQGVQTQVLWIADGSIGNFGWVKLQGIDFSGSYDTDLGELGALNAGITGTYYLHEYKVNNVTASDPEAATVQDVFHTTLAAVNGLAQNGVESLPRMRYRARLGWSNGPLSVTTFVNYISHYFSTQNPPPNVNFACATQGGTVGGGTFPCVISNYTQIEPPYYTFDLSLGYDTGDQPTNPYLQHVGIQLVVLNILNKLPPFEYRTSQPAAFDTSQSDQGRTFGIVITKAW